MYDFYSILRPVHKLTFLPKILADGKNYIPKSPAPAVLRIFSFGAPRDILHATLAQVFPDAPVRLDSGAAGTPAVRNVAHRTVAARQ